MHAQIVKKSMTLAWSWSSQKGCSVGSNQSKPRKDDEQVAGARENAAIRRTAQTYDMDETTILPPPSPKAPDIYATNENTMRARPCCPVPIRTDCSVPSPDQFFVHSRMHAAAQLSPMLQCRSLPCGFGTVITRSFLPCPVCPPEPFVESKEGSRG